jgi:hypothetical protein
MVRSKPDHTVASEHPLTPQCDSSVPDVRGSKQPSWEALRDPAWRRTTGNDRVRRH